MAAPVIAAIIRGGMQVGLRTGGARIIRGTPPRILRPGNNNSPGGSVIRFPKGPQRTSPRGPSALRPRQIPRTRPGTVPPAGRSVDCIVGYKIKPPNIFIREGTGRLHAACNTLPLGGQGCATDPILCNTPIGMWAEYRTASGGCGRIYYGKISRAQPCPGAGTAPPSEVPNRPTPHPVVRPTPGGDPTGDPTHSPAPGSNPTPSAPGTSPRPGVRFVPPFRASPSARPGNRSRTEEEFVEGESWPIPGTVQRPDGSLGPEWAAPPLRRLREGIHFSPLPVDQPQANQPPGLPVVETEIVFQPNGQVRTRPGRTTIEKEGPPYEGKERKFEPSTEFGRAAKRWKERIQRGFGKATEIGDLIEDLYDALPEHLQKKGRTGLKQKAQIVYANWQSIRWRRAAVNIVSSQLEDMVVGRAQKKVDKAWLDAKLQSAPMYTAGTLSTRAGKGVTWSGEGTKPWREWGYRMVGE